MTPFLDPSVLLLGTVIGSWAVFGVWVAWLLWCAVHNSLDIRQLFRKETL